MNTFTSEAKFESELVKTLASQKGWETEILKNVTEEDLIQNWANILFENNKEIDKLNGVPLTSSEMQQILSKIQELKTPLKLNSFINGRSVTITRDNPDDELHLGKEVSLKIYDRREIAAGQSRYQIVQQPRYKRQSEIRNDRRGDVILLINGMPLIHIELKRSGTHVSQAVYQIEKYMYEGHFTGLFSLIQIFVAMTPDTTKYFANPGIDGKFNKDYQFQWADFNNEPVKDWKKIASDFLSIPMAHQLIGFYTVADNTDGVLKVMRSYQIYAASKISSRVAQIDWRKPDTRGGYIWHTTGSGKTMTSFKSAQLISTSKDADKVIFLMDRIELGTQSLREYKGYADESITVQDTEDTYALISKLKSDDPADTLIVTSIQKLSNIKSDENGLYSHDLDTMRSKRIVIIIDEAHRTVFGESMLPNIREAFPNAVLFGFTGTPIQKENSRKESDTSTIFGNELHRYSLSDGIRDKNVLGFYPYKVLTYKNKDLRKAVALEQAKAVDIQDALEDPLKNEIYSRFMNPTLVRMAGDYDKLNKYIKGIEDFIPRSQYEREDHRKAVVSDIKDNWQTLSNNKFHAIFATSSINEAILYYKLLKEEFPALKVSALFDPNIDNNEGFQFKEEGLELIIDDYNKRYNTNFTFSSHSKFKKDISNRLAHKKPYDKIENEPQSQLDLLIVVDQMLTGFDSKWLNTLYLDKKLEYENIIQAFSRTNRLFGLEKRFGVIRYYRYPNTMERNIERAVKLYSGDRPFGLFVEHLDQNLEKLNFIFKEIKDLFNNALIFDFSKLPNDLDVKSKFASLFNSLTKVLESSKIQGFSWNKLEYEFPKSDHNPKRTIKVNIDENTYNTLLARYKELFEGEIGGNTGSSFDSVPFEIDSYIMEIDTGIIDSNYMNSRFEKYLKSLDQENISLEEKESILNELHKSFATLTQEEQKFANVFLSDVQSGNVILEPSKTFKDYISEYQSNAKDEQISKLVNALGLDADKLKLLMSSYVTPNNLNEFGRFDALKSTVDREKAKAFFESKENQTLPLFKVSIKIHDLLTRFILNDGFDIDDNDK